MGEALTIEARHERGYPIVTVAGEIDIATAARLRERLFELAASGRPLVADLDQVRFIDSAGLAALVGAAKRAAAHGGSLHVVCARPRIRQLFRLTGLDRQVPPARTLDEALDALAAAGHAPLASGARRSPDHSPGRGARKERVTGGEVAGGLGVSSTTERTRQWPGPCRSRPGSRWTQPGRQPGRSSRWPAPRRWPCRRQPPSRWPRCCGR